MALYSSETVRGKAARVELVVALRPASLGGSAAGTGTSQGLNRLSKTVRLNICWRDSSCHQYRNCSQKVSELILAFRDSEGGSGTEDKARGRAGGCCRLC